MKWFFPWRNFKVPQFKRYLLYSSHRILPRKTPSHKLFWSIFLGVFIGIFPSLGFSLILLIPICIFFRLPIIPATSANFIANPLTLFGFFYPFGYWLGQKICQPSAISFDFIDRFSKIQLNQLLREISYLWSEAAPHFLAFMIGINLEALFFALFLGGLGVFGLKLLKGNTARF